MALLHNSSVPCTKSELDLLLTPPTQASILSGKWLDFYPVAVLEGDSPIQFIVAGSAEEYIDMGQS